MSNNIHQFFSDQISGKIQFLLAEFWFKLLSQSIMTAGLMAASKKLDSIELSAFACISIGATYLWLNHQLNKSVYYFWPETEPSATKDYKPNRYKILIGFVVSAIFMLLPFKLSMLLTELISQTKI